MIYKFPSCYILKMWILRQSAAVRLKLKSVCIRDPQKSFYFLIFLKWQCHKGTPRTPPPFELNCSRNFGRRKKQAIKSYFFLNGAAFTPPPVMALPLKMTFLRLPLYKQDDFFGANKIKTYTHIKLILFDNLLSFQQKLPD